MVIFWIIKSNFCTALFLISICQIKLETKPATSNPCIGHHPAHYVSNNIKTCVCHQ